MEKKKKIRGTNSFKAAIIIAVMVAVTAAVLYFGINAVLTKDPLENISSVTLPVITTRLTKADGEEIDLQTLFAVHVPRNAGSDVTKEMLEKNLTEIMTELDPAELLSGGKVDYINANATELLNERLADLDITTRVLVQDISSNKYMQLTDPAGGQRGEVTESLFENVD